MTLPHVVVGCHDRCQAVPVVEVDLRHDPGTTADEGVEAPDGLEALLILPKWQGDLSGPGVVVILLDATTKLIGKFQLHHAFIMHRSGASEKGLPVKLSLHREVTMIWRRQTGLSYPSLAPSLLVKADCTVDHRATSSSGWGF